jgi:hypothetical protein
MHSGRHRQPPAAARPRPPPRLIQLRCCIRPAAWWRLRLAWLLLLVLLVW